MNLANKAPILKLFKNKRCTMGRINVNIKVENIIDLALVQQGLRSPQEVRSVELEAIVDTGASLLCLPKSVIEMLDLTEVGTRRVKTANGPVERNIYRNAQLTVLNRTCAIDVIELLEDTPPLVGYIPLENLDLVPDPTTETLNPAHGDEIVLDLY
jgi:predicted aspartyl protease